MKRTGGIAGEWKPLKQWMAVGMMVAMACANGYAGAPAVDLRVGEGFREPLGFHDPTPTFSWTLPEGVEKQSAYRIEVKADAVLWDSGWVASDQSVHVPYGGPSTEPLPSRQGLTWRVRYRDGAGRDSGWSRPASLEMGLLSNEDWQAKWIRMSDVKSPAADQPKIEVVKAVYGVLNAPGKQHDVTEAIRKRVTNGECVVVAGNHLVGDPAPGVVKQMRLDYTLDGEPKQQTLAENARLDLVTGKPPVEKKATYVPQYLRREFEARGKIQRARLYVTAKGLYEVWLNGVKVGKDCFVPGWTSYGHRMETLTYDVTDSVRTGANALGAVLGEGWYAGRLMKKNNVYPKLRPALLLQLEITYADGSVQTIVTDHRWVATDQGPIRSSGIYDGEVYDANLEMPGWNAAGYDDSDWNGVVMEDVAAKPALVPKAHAPVRATAELPALGVTEPKPGRFVFDLGQNMVGWARLNLPVQQGQTITLRFAEMLNKDGTLYTANYRDAKSTDFYTAAETGMISWSPSFTFHGFRYVELSGLPEGAKPSVDWVTGVVLHSEMRRIGDFTSSHDKLNQLQRNIVWGQRGNFLDIPTDCPQRDERLGWTGDAQVFAPTALFNYDSHAFFKSWLRTMRDEQHPDGAVPHVIPETGVGAGSPGWQDAATIIPWAVYVRTGDREVLADHFEMMERLVGWYRRRAKDHLIPKIGGWGDWLQPYAKQMKGDTPDPLLGTAFYALGADILAKSAGVLGRGEEATRYAGEAAAVKRAFTAHYFDESGKLQNAPETQTAYLLAIAFDLLPEELRGKAAGHLARLVHEADGHLRTGFLGTPFIASVLDSTGHSELACTVLFKETYPSWFFSINQGATTMWERWNSYSHQAGFGSAGMNSFNHYAYGAIGQWMVERLAGLAPDPANPGYKHFFVRPLLAPQLDRARAELDTPYGRAAAGWSREGGRVVLEVTVPSNASATIEFPDGRPPESVGAGTYRVQLEDAP